MTKVKGKPSSMVSRPLNSNVSCYACVLSSYLSLESKTKKAAQHNFLKFTFKVQLRILTYFCAEEVQSSQATCMTLVVVGWEGLGRPTQFIKTTCTDLQLCLK